MFGTGGGLLAASAIWGLVLIEEAGVPLPFFPGDGLLITGGVIIGTGSVSPFLFLPGAYLASLTGAMTGFAWARRIGDSGLSRLADRLHARRYVDRAADHLRRRGSRSVIAGRFLPGTRVYTSLVAGAIGMPPRTFLAGLAPASALWVAVFTGLGLAIGVPAGRYLSSAETIVLLLAAQAVLVVATLAGLRYVRSGERAHRGGHGRLTAAIAVDIGVVAVFTFVARVLLPGTPEGTWLYLLTGLVYALSARFAFGATAGERLTGFSYMRAED